MRSNSSKIVVCLLLGIGLLFDIICGILVYNSDAYADGELFRVVNSVNLIFLILTILIIFIRHSQRRKKYFKLTRLNSKEPESIEYLEFKEIQYRLWQVAGAFFVIAIILTICEIFF